MSGQKHKIRPAARLLKTIGQDLIKDVYAAIVELVKNSYDADSPDAIVHFTYNESVKRLRICIEDHGHGMSHDTVVNKWLVPATDDKLRRKKSENGRVLQGRKGIGRFAASVLGERMLLETTHKGETTSLILDMDYLDEIEYLDELELDVSVSPTDKKNSTLIEIEKDDVSAESLKEIWTPKQLRKLLVELRSLISPEEVYRAASEQGFHINYDQFSICLKFHQFPVNEYEDREIQIKPFPVLGLFDYRLSGTVDNDGTATLNYENQNIPSIPPEKFNLKIPLDRDGVRDYPGPVYIDLRVYDRDPESIDNIINRGLKDPDTGEYVGKMEARHILDEHYGVGIYREQFRVRPYGEQSYDWLDLDKSRVQDPSHKIGHNQIIGFVYVRPEEESGLTEKSARDGLTENRQYFGLKFIVSRFVNQLESRRFKYREKAQKGGRYVSVEDEISNLFDFESVTRNISRELDALGIPSEQRADVQKVVDVALGSEKQKKSGVAKRIRDTIAIYQGQATLGKITHVLLHEGRKHIKYISETIPRIIKWAKVLSEGGDTTLKSTLEDRGDKVITHTKGISYLFKKIEPLARTRRAPARKFNLKNIIDNAFGIFASEMQGMGIAYTIQSDLKDPNVTANEMDLITVFSNLIENSIYWHKDGKLDAKSIFVRIYKDDENTVIEFSDNGPGFQGGNLELMFEPGYSMKPDGTGLGLALAGEAMARIGGEIEAKLSDKGAAFEVIFRANKS